MPLPPITFILNDYRTVIQVHYTDRGTREAIALHAAYFLSQFTLW